MNSFCLAIAALLVNVAIQGVLLTAAVALALKLVPAISAAMRSMVWSVAFVLLIGLHFVPRAATGTTHHVQPGWAMWLGCIWVASSAWRLLQFAGAVVRLNGLCRRAVPLGESISVSRYMAVPLCVSSEIYRPTVAGFLRPRVLLPESLLANISPDERNYVLLHEVTHLRRADNWTNLLQKLALIVFPLDPALLWIERRLCREREFACDERVVAETSAPRSYALCLTTLAERGMFARASSLALGAWHRRSELVQRVERMLRPSSSTSRARNTIVGATLCFALCAGAFALAREPQIVSFAGPLAPSLAPSLAAATDAGTPLAGARMVLTSARLPQLSRREKFKLPADTKHNSPSLSPAVRRITKRQTPHLQSTMYLPHVVRRSHATQRTAAFLRTSTFSNPSLPVFVPVATYAVATPDGWFVITI